MTDTPEHDLTTRTALVMLEAGAKWARENGHPDDGKTAEDFLASGDEEGKALMLAMAGAALDFARSLPSTPLQERIRLTGEVETEVRDGVPVRKMRVTQELADKVAAEPENVIGAATIRDGKVYRPWTLIPDADADAPEPDAYLYVLDDCVSAKPIFTLHRWPPNHNGVRELPTRFREVALWVHV